MKKIVAAMVITGVTVLVPSVAFAARPTPAGPVPGDLPPCLVLKLTPLGSVVCS